MAAPVLAAVGLCFGALSTGAVVLATVVSGMALGPLGGGASAPVGAVSAATPLAALPPASLTVIQQVAAACPGLDWALLGGAVLTDPALEGELASVATDLCLQPVPARPAALGALMPGPVEGQVAEVLAFSLTADAWLTGQAATAISFAATNLGVPYRWGGTGPGGFDCSGLTLEAYKAAGVALPRVAQDQFDAGPPVPSTTVLVPGDLVFFGSGPHGVTHVGLYIGGGDMIDAPHSGAFVRIEEIPTILGARFGSDMYVGATRPVK